MAVIAGDIDDRQRDACVQEPAAQLDAGLTIQIDIEDDAESVAEIAVSEQRAGGIEQRRIKAVFPEQPLNASQHGSVIIYDKNRSSVRQDRRGPSFENRSASCHRRPANIHIHARQIRAVIQL